MLLSLLGSGDVILLSDSNQVAPIDVTIISTAAQEVIGLLIEVLASLGL